MQNFIDVSDGKKGFALYTKGLKEVGTVNNDGAIINLTLSERKPQLENVMAMAEAAKE
jgi:hypothetical protein